MQIKRSKIRCNVDLARRTIRDVKTGAYPTFPAGSDIQFEFAFWYDSTLIDIASWDALKIDIVNGTNIVGSRLMEKTVAKTPGEGMPAEERLDSSLTSATWNDVTKQHALITFTDEQSLFANPGSGENSLPLWLILRATTSTGETFTVCADKALAYKDGHTGTGAPEAGDTAYYTAAQIDAIFVKKSALTLEFQSMKVWNGDQGKFQYLGIRGLAGAEEAYIYDEI